MVLNGRWAYDATDRDLDGHIEPGRLLHYSGAHCRGQNHDSIGIVLVGPALEKDRIHGFSHAQFVALARFIWRLPKWTAPLLNTDRLREEPDAVIFGHNHFNRHKTCPVFDVHWWIETYFKPHTRGFEVMPQGA